MARHLRSSCRRRVQLASARPVLNHCTSGRVAIQRDRTVLYPSTSAEDIQRIKTLRLVHHIVCFLNEGKHFSNRGTLELGFAFRASQLWFVEKP